MERELEEQKTQIFTTAHASLKKQAPGALADTHPRTTPGAIFIQPVARPRLPRGIRLY
jgi:hypothetical protein